MREKKKNPKNVKYSCRVNTSKKMFWKRHSVQKKKKTNAMSSLKTQRKHSLLRYFRFSDVFFFFFFVCLEEVSTTRKNTRTQQKKNITPPRHRLQRSVIRNNRGLGLSVRSFQVGVHYNSFYRRDNMQQLCPPGKSLTEICAQCILFLYQ